MTDAFDFPMITAMKERYAAAKAENDRAMSRHKEEQDKKRKDTEARTVKIVTQLLNQWGVGDPDERLLDVLWDAATLSLWDGYELLFIITSLEQDGTDPLLSVEVNLGHHELDQGDDWVKLMGRELMPTLWAPDMDTFWTTFVWGIDQINERLSQMRERNRHLRG